MTNPWQKGRSGASIPSATYGSHAFWDEFRQYVRAELEELLTSPEGCFSAEECEKILGNFDNQEKMPWSIQLNDRISCCGQDVRLEHADILRLKEEWLTKPSDSTRESLGLFNPWENRRT